MLRQPPVRTVSTDMSRFARAAPAGSARVLAASVE
jgi:hypothetical protein